MRMSRTSEIDARRSADKTWLTTISIVLACVTTVLGLQHGDFTYTVADGKATIVGFTKDRVGPLSIPTVFEGTPVVAIGKGAFDKSLLSTVEIPNSVTSIGESAFAHCDKLTKVMLPDSLTEIGPKGFFFCVALVRIDIPKNVVKIGENAFDLCVRLEAIDVAEENHTFCDVDGVLFSKDKRQLIRYSGGRAGVYTVQDKVCIIKSRAFSCCLGLTEVTFPSSLSKIEAEAFKDCHNLKCVYFKGDAPVTGACAFGYHGPKVFYCSNAAGWGKTFCGLPTTDQWPVSDFTYVVTNGGVTVTGYLGAGTSIKIPETIAGLPVTGIGKKAFYDSRLTSISLPDRLLQIEDYAFGGCGALAEITLPSRVADIGECAFNGCVTLKRVTIPGCVTNIGKDAFLECGQPALESFSVEESNPSYSATGGVLFSKDGAEIVLYPDGRTGSYTIPSNTSRIGKWAFGNVANLSAIEVPPDNPFFSSTDGVLFNKDRTTLIRCPGGKSGQYTVPDSVTNIGYRAFALCNDLTAVLIPASVRCLGPAAFAGCERLTCVRLPGNLTELCAGVFQYCTALEKLTIPPNVTCIGEYAFANCTSLSNLDIPESVVSIGVDAFEGCDVGIRVGPGELVWSNYVYSINAGDTHTVTLRQLIRPSAVVNIPPTIAGKTVTGFGATFSKIVSLGIRLSSCDDRRGISTFECETYAGRDNLVGVNIFDGVTNAARYANELWNIARFNSPDDAFGCKELTSVSIPDSVTSIEDMAFFNCRSLTNVVIGSGVVSIGRFAFGLAESKVLEEGSDSSSEIYREVRKVSVTVSKQNPVFTSLDGVLAERKNLAKAVLSYRLEGTVPVVGVVDNIGKYIFLNLPEGMHDPDHLTPTIKVPEGATVSPESGVPLDLDQAETHGHFAYWWGPVHTVTAADGTTQTYKVGWFHSRTPGVSRKDIVPRNQ